MKYGIKEYRWCNNCKLGYSGSVKCPCCSGTNTKKIIEKKEKKMSDTDYRVEAHDKAVIKNKAFVRNFVNEINEKLKNSVVKLKLDGNTSFQAIYDFKDESYIDTEAYANGQAYMYFSKKFYELLRNEAAKNGFEIKWNNTKCIGYFPFYTFYKKELEEFNKE